MKFNKIETVKNKNDIYAIIIRGKNQFKKRGVNFISKNQDLIQVGFINHRKKHIIKSHIHRKKKNN